VRTAELQRRLQDRRGGRVVFVSHCLLNENVRYPGGACRPGSIREWLDRWESEGVGICQMPCPEQRAWGGVAKRYIAPAFAAQGSALWPARRWVTGIFVLYTRIRYRLMARRVAAEVRDYLRSGYQVVGLVGVAGSPSCGVTRTLDVHSWLEAVGQAAPDELTPDVVNRAVISSMRPGRGWFISAIARNLDRTRITPPLTEHDLIAELREEPHIRRTGSTT
jgi:uncharacterized protein YbbK (DUF523 family)